MPFSEVLGKDIIYWDELDSGVFLLTKSFFQTLHGLVHHLSTDVKITDVVRFLIIQGHRFDTCNVSDCFWVDVDLIRE